MDLEPIAPPEGIHFDELSKVRLLDTENAQQTEQLREECAGFVESEHPVL